MSRGAIISLVASTLIGLLAVAATVSLDEATKNIASWSGPLFWIGIVLIMVPMLIGIRTLAGRINKRSHQTVPSESPPTDHWAQRKRLEISVIANVSAHREPNDSPITGEPENSRLRELKDAIDAGELDAETDGDRPDVSSTVTLHDFIVYVAATNKPYWVELMHRWQAVQSPSENELSNELKEKRISLLKFLEIAKKRSWDMLNPGGYEAFDLIHGISEAAGLGDLVVLGKKMDRHSTSFSFIGRRQPIPANFWHTHYIEPTSCFIFTNPGLVVGFADENEKIHTKYDHGDSPAYQDYADLYIQTKGLMNWLENDADSYRGHYQKTYGN